MQPEDILDLARSLEPHLPPGWGFVSLEDGAGWRRLALHHTEPPLRTGWIFWLGKDDIRAACAVFPDDTYFDALARALAVVELLEPLERARMASWN